MPVQAVPVLLVPPARRLAFGRENVPPLLLTVALVGLALAWNAQAGLRWTLSPALLLAAPLACFALAAVYSAVRPEPVVAEAALYLGLWFLYPVFGTQLTYLANRLAYPLQDRLFDSWDAALGFHWLAWARVIAAHPLLETVQIFAYESCLWQSLLLVVIFAVWGPKGRNSEFLTSMLLALAATIAVNLFLPSLGPAGFHGLKSQTADIIRSLRNGDTAPYDYAGVIAFPSFHTVIAILYTAAARGNRYRLAAALVLNAMMLSAIPYSGNHYLSDMLAGAAIAAAALAAARRLLRVWDGAKVLRCENAVSPGL